MKKKEITRLHHFDFQYQVTSRESKRSTAGDDIHAEMMFKK